MSRFIGLTLSNSFATFVHYEAEYNTLRTIDNWFININSLQTDNSASAEGMLLASAHSNYRAAVSLALGGQGHAAHSVFRIVLECGLYALHISKNRGLSEKWLNRNKSRNEQAEIESEFSYENLTNTLSRQNKRFTDSIDRLYQWCNDFGAHPNERSITASMEPVEGSNGKDYRYNYLTVDEANMKTSLQTCIQVGLGTLYLFQYVFSDRYSMLGLPADMDALRQSLTR